MTTIKDIAKEAGVSLGTVSNVLNKKNNVTLRKIELVNAAIKKLGYQKNNQASLLKMGAHHHIAVILPTLSESKYAALYEALDGYFSRKGYKLSLYLTQHNEAKELQILAELAGENVPVVVACSCLPNAKSYNKIFSKNTKIIYAYSSPKGAKNVVDIDYTSSIQEMIHRAEQDNIEKIGIISAQKFALTGKITPIYCTKTQPFDVVEFVSEHQLSAILVMDIAQAQAVYNAFYFSNLTPPHIYTLSHQPFTPDARFITYYINTDSLVRNIVNLIENKPLEPILPNKGFLFSEPLAHSKKTLNILAISSPSTAALKKMVSHFTRQTGIQVNIETVSFSDIASIIADPQKAAQYDVVRIDMERLPWLHSHLKPISFIETDVLRQHYSSNILQRFCVVNEQLYAIPFDPSIQVLFYQKAIFEDMLVQRRFYEQYKTELLPPNTFEEFNRLAEFFSQPFEKKANIHYGTSLIAQPEILALEFLTRYYALTEKMIFAENQPAFDETAGLAVLENLKALSESTVILQDVWWDKAVAKFEKKETALLLIYANHYAQLANHIPASVGCVPVPGNMPLLGGGSLAMLKQSKKTEEVAAFFHWFLNDEIHEQFTTLGGFSARKNIFLNPKITQCRPWLSIIEEMDFNGVRENSIADDTPINLFEIEKEIGRVLLQFINGEINNLAAIEQMSKIFNQPYT